MQEKDAQRLLEKFRAGQCTEEEKIRLRNWFHTLNLEQPTDLSAAELEDIGDEMWASIGAQTRPARNLWPRLAIAASVIAILSFGSYFLLRQQAPQEQVVQHDVSPGKNTATLTLSNGKKIILSDALKGQIAQEAGVNITKTADGQVVYTIAGNTTTVNQFNTLSTAKGETYKINLPDGTQVWLNAASSLKYPTRFEKDRLVELTGEAYFEVTHNPKMPFKVKSNYQITEDIGTAFNINTYSDENAAVTTLVEGAIKVNQTLLKPGQAASLGTSGKITVSETDTEEATAWKNGKFNFKDADIQTVMRQFARWYDVEVEYEGEKPNTSINGEVYRNVNASQALKILTYLNIHFRIENKKIIITK